MTEDQSSGTGQAETLQSYEEFVYPSGVYYYTHPDRIAVAGALAGASPMPVEKCRVLELGCSDGGNLNSMASTLPDSEFVGIDLAPRQIEMAEQARAAAGLGNVAYHATSFTDLGDEIGKFDYIIAHGLFSWIPVELQDELLAACTRLLTPNGLAYTSFNTFPGARNIMWLREKLLYHVRDIEGSKERAKAAWVLAHFIAKVQEVQSAPHHEYMQELLATFKKMLDPEAYFYHEYLEADNNPLLLSEFLAKADKAGLRYLGDTCPRNRTLDGIDPGLAEVIRRFTSDPQEQEQYLDLALDTGFRRAILSRADAPISEPIRPALPARWVATCHGAAAEPDEDGKKCFVRINGERFCTDHQPTIAALEKITGAWPAACSLSELFEDNEGDTLSAEASQVLHDLYRDEFIRLQERRPPVANKITERPLVTGMVRSTAQQLHQIPTLYHSNVAMGDAVASFLLAHMDGTRDCDQLAALLLEGVRDKKVSSSVRGVPLHLQKNAEERARELVGEKLQKSLNLALLMDTDGQNC